MVSTSWKLPFWILGAIVTSIVLDFAGFDRHGGLRRLAAFRLHAVDIGLYARGGVYLVYYEVHLPGI